ncbi:MAG: capsular polysaccharide biosynthesis protein [Planctomycetaceae bacterium]|nr:MAG: capsular polysaccharide biosynthesis protein [Planctomycetaceae bacterium]
MYGVIYRHLLLPTFDRLKGRRTHAYWQAALQAQWQPRHVLEQQQFQALQRLLNHAYEHCAYYRHTWQQRDLNPRQLTTFEEFTRWPLLTRQLLREQLHQLQAQVPMRVYRKSTGGSTGEPVHFVLNTDSNERRTALMWRGYGWAGCWPGERQLLVWGTPLGTLPWWKRAKMRLHQWFEHQRLLSCFEFTPLQMQRHWAAWNRYRPQYVIAYTNPLYEFARFLEAERLPIHAPRAIITGAEKLYDFQRETLQRVFQAPVFETYGSREFMLIGAECEHHAGLHLSIDNLLLEIVDEQGRPVPAGQEGLVVVTDLYNYALPFIRYVTGDRAVAGFESCRCGRGLPLLRKVVGRQLDVLTTPSGRVIPGEFFPHLLKDFPSVRRFQVVQTAPERIVIHLVVDGSFSLDQHAHLQELLRAGVGPEVRLELAFVDDIPLTAAGKHRVVINQCRTAATHVTRQDPQSWHEALPSLHCLQGESR